MSVKLTHEEWFKKYQSNIHPNLKLLSRYDGVRNKIKVQCLVCNKIYETLPSVLISGCNCKHCASVKTNDCFVEELKNINPTVTPLENYISDRDCILVRCNVCNHEWKSRPTHLIRGHACPKCSHDKLGYGKRKTQAEFEYELSVINPTVKCLGKYEGRTKPVLVQSIICGHIWEATPNNLVFGKSGCPICMMSQGERVIYNYLLKNHIQFVPQKEFPELIGVNGGNLSYDFYLPYYNMLIEYQGEQHDKPHHYFGGQEQFIIQQIHDARKCEYATNNNIELLEIWYWDFNNIEQILNKKLHINGNQKSA